MIELQGVSKAYQTAAGRVVALADATLSVADGQFAVIRGPSGSGKTTLLSIVGGLASPSAGRVAVAGRDLTAMSPAERSRFRAATVGFVFQTFHLLPYLTVLDNVLVAATAGAAAARSRALELLERCQLGPRLRHRPDQLSTGECQRVAVARAMMNRPALILADEPTGNLDPDNAAAIFDMLAAFRQAGGTVLVVTHQDVGAKHAGQTILLRGGAVVGT